MKAYDAFTVLVWVAAVIVLVYLSWVFGVRVVQSFRDVTVLPMNFTWS